MTPTPNIIKISNDGSHTVFSEKFQATHHSLHGAITESKVVFIEAGLSYLPKPEKNKIKVFEMGFGTGLNAFLSSLWSEANQIPVSYTSVEAYPISAYDFNQLNYGDLLQSPDLYNLILNSAWHKRICITAYFDMMKIQTTIQDYHTENLFDIIYYDAFGPSTQPELWETSQMQKMYNMLNIDGILVTYCSQGQFRRTLKDVGFTVSKLAGPPGKREIVRAQKTK